MTDTSPRWASISGHITHGTATPVAIPSVIPEKKQDKEVFWATTLASRLPEMKAFNPSVAPCVDDSNGNHDVIVSLNNGDAIGIQVTELTYELERARQAQAGKFAAEVIECFAKRGLSSARRLLVHCFAPFVAGNRYVVPKGSTELMMVFVCACGRGATMANERPGFGLRGLKALREAHVWPSFASNCRIRTHLGCRAPLIVCVRASGSPDQTARRAGPRSWRDRDSGSCGA